jgi:hypothetical protein
MLGPVSDIYLQADADGAQVGQTAVFYVENSRKLQCRSFAHMDRLRYKLKRLKGLIDVFSRTLQHL